MWPMFCFGMYKIYETTTTNWMMNVCCEDYEDHMLCAPIEKNVLYELCTFSHPLFESKITQHWRVKFGGNLVPPLMMMIIIICM